MERPPLKPALVVALKVAGCGVAAWAAWRALGPVGLVLSAPLWGLVMARPLFDAVAAAGRIVRAHAIGDLQGSNYEFRGNRISIAEGDDRHRWLSVQDVRKVLKDLPGDGTLCRMFPSGCREWDEPPVLRIQAEALAAYLDKSTDAASLRFKTWLERVVVLPAAKLRGGA